MGSMFRGPLTGVTRSDITLHVGGGGGGVPDTPEPALQRGVSALGGWRAQPGAGGQDTAGDYSYGGAVS